MIDFDIIYKKSILLLAWLSQPQNKSTLKKPEVRSSSQRSGKGSAQAGRAVLGDSEQRD